MNSTRISGICTCMPKLCFLGYKQWFIYGLILESFHTNYKNFSVHLYRWNDVKSVACCRCMKPWRSPGLVGQFLGLEMRHGSDSTIPWSLPRGGGKKEEASTCLSDLIFKNSPEGLCACCFLCLEVPYQIFECLASECHLDVSSNSISWDALLFLPLPPLFYHGL